MSLQVEAVGFRRIDWAHNRWRNETTATLKGNLEMYLWDRAEIAADLERDPASWAFGQNTLDFIDAQVELIVGELRRREGLRDRAGAPPWPATWRPLGPDKERVRAALGIDVYLDRRGVRLNRHHGRATCQCPLPGHEDGTASFSIDLGKGLWHCFGCGRGGDVFTLHAYLTGDAEFGRAVDDLAREAGIVEVRRTIAADRSVGHGPIPIRGSGRRRG